MLDDFNAVENKAQLQEEFNTYCNSEVDNLALLNGVGDILEQQYLRLKLGYELLIEGDIVEVFETASEINENNNEIFSLIKERFRKYSICMLIEKLDLVEIKASLEEQLGGTIEDKIEEAKQILEDVETLIEDLESSEQISLENFEQALDSIAENEESKINVLDAKISSFFADLLFQMSLDDNDEEKFIIPFELQEKINNLKMLDFNFSFDEYFGFIIELIYMELNEHVDLTDSKYLTDYYDVESEAKQLVLQYDNVDDLYEYIGGVVPDVVMNIDSSLAKMQSFMDSETLSFNDFIVGYRFLSIDLKNVLKLVDSSYVLLAMRIIDLKLRDNLLVESHSDRLHLDDYITNVLGYEDYPNYPYEEIPYNQTESIYFNNLVKADSSDNPIVNCLFTPMYAYKITQQSLKRITFIIVPNTNEYRFFKLMEDETEKEKYHDWLYDEKFKPIIINTIGLANENRLRDLLKESILNKNEKDVHNVSHEIALEGDEKITKTVSHGFVGESFTEILEGAEIRDSVSYSKNLYSSIKRGLMQKYNSYASAWGLSLEDENFTDNNNLFTYTSYSTPDRIVRSFNLNDGAFEEVTGESTTAIIEHFYYNYNVSNLFLDVYESDLFLTVDNYTDEDKQVYLNEVPLWVEINSYWTDGVNNFEIIKDEVIEFTDELIEDVGELIDDGFNWLSALVGYKDE